jgi:hypothetical protein
MQLADPFKFLRSGCFGIAARCHTRRRELCLCQNFGNHPFNKEIYGRSRYSPNIPLAPTPPLRYPARMKTEIEKSLERELARLEPELMANPIYIKVSRIKELLAAYRGTPTVAATVGQFVEPVAPKGQPHVREVGGSTKRGRVYAALEELIRSTGKPVHRKLMLDHLISNNLMGKEKNPMQSLAIYLSDAKDRFKSVGPGVWGLASDIDESGDSYPSKKEGASLFSQ